MMKQSIDVDALLAPIPGDNPAGEDLRYSPVYDEITEARREDDTLDRGQWQRDLKKADWDRVVKLCVAALVEKTKDLQIAAWLTEALTEKEDFEGLSTGLTIVNRLMSDFWEHLYPEIDDGDLDFRAGRIEYLNNNLWQRVNQIPLTDKDVTAGYSWFQWDESRKVGYEADASKAKVRAELLSEGKLSAEEFDSAVTRSSKAFYVSLAENVTSCREGFEKLDQLADEKFGRDAPRLAELRTSLEQCDQLVSKILKEKRVLEPDEEPESAPEVAEELASAGEETETEPAQPEVEKLQQEAAEPEVEKAVAKEPATKSQGQAASPLASMPLPSAQFSESASPEKTVWETALKALQNSGVQKGLEQLLAAACSAPSLREKNRYRLLMAQLCLKASRPDLARPIVEELHALIEELQLERWESPLWIAEVLDALYRCLTSGTASDEDTARAQQVFQKLCTIDVTRAVIYS
jgi:type VI secretion system protein ImpA